MRQRSERQLDVYGEPWLSQRVVRPELVLERLEVLIVVLLLTRERLDERVFDRECKSVALTCSERVDSTIDLALGPLSDREIASPRAVLVRGEEQRD